MQADPGAAMHGFYYEETTWKARPTLSPDGAKLVYSSYLGRQWQQLWAMPPQAVTYSAYLWGLRSRHSPLVAGRPPHRVHLQ
jgi:hypothetical protein